MMSGPRQALAEMCLRNKHWRGLLDQTRAERERDREGVSVHEQAATSFVTAQPTSCKMPHASVEALKVPHTVTTKFVVEKGGIQVVGMDGPWARAACLTDTLQAEHLSRFICRGGFFFLFLFLFLWRLLWDSFDRLIRIERRAARVGTS